MNIRKTAELLKSGANIERDMYAARSGERLAFVPSKDRGDIEQHCENCKRYARVHVRESGILFCPEWALRERWGR